MGILNGGRMAMRQGLILVGWVCLATAALAQGQQPDSRISEDLTRLIPADAVAAVAWSGVPTQEQSFSAIERRLMQPDFQSLCGVITELVRDIGSQEFGGDMVDLVVAALAQPGMAYVRIAPGENEPQVNAGLVLAPSKAADGVETTVRLLCEQAEPLQDIEHRGATLQSFAVEDGVTLSFGRVDDRFVMVVGIAEDEEGRLLLERTAGETPEWWHRTIAKTGVPRPIAIGSVNFTQLLEIMRQIDADIVELEDVLAITGAGGVQRMSTALGFDDESYLHRTWIETEIPRHGLLASLDSGKLTAAQLPSLPPDTTAALVMDCDLARTIKLVLESVESHNVGLSDDLQEGLREWKVGQGGESLESLASAVGSPWTLYHSPEQGGWMTGFSAIFPVTDVDKLKGLETQLAQWFEERAADGGFFFPPNFSSSEYRGEEIHAFMDFGNAPLFVAWTLTESHLIVSSSPTTIKPILDRLADPSPAEVTDLPLIDDRASLVISADPKRLLGSPLGMGQFVGRMLEIEMYQEIFGFRNRPRKRREMISTQLPYGEMIKEIARQDRLAIYPEANGIMIEGRFTLPGSELLVAGGGVVIAVNWLDNMGLDPMLFISPGAAKRNKSLLNLRMIGLAMHNYHDTFRQLPKSASTDDMGQPLLSWRVQLLPFLEEQELYQQFHLDEPWDSEHNRKLVEKMPQVFRSPNSKAEDGYTNYLTIRSPDSLFPPNKVNGQVRKRGIRFADIRDGTSNTLMVVEANDKSAVIWSKPDDLEPDMLVVKQMAGLYRDQFAVVFGDGAVMWLPADIDSGTLMKLISRAGGEPVDIPSLRNDGHDHNHDHAPVDAIELDEAPRAIREVPRDEIR